MFKKIIDHSQAHQSHTEYIQSFGTSCLDKIKNIETKFNQVEQQIESTPFDIIALKVKTMLDCYQVISHQIYSAFQSVNLHSLGHSIVKMFLQISSAIKWLIKSFTINYAKSIHNINFSKQRGLDSKPETFRQRQIDRYMRKGAIEQLDSDEEEKYPSNIYSCFGQSKENFIKSKNRVLAVNSSNLPLILQDTVDYLSKKSQYINKFIALRENYEGMHRFDQLLTSQSIMESEVGQKSMYAAASDKFKQILNKLHAMKCKKEVATQQKGIQVSNTPCQKSKKLNTERNKIKTLSEEIEKEKLVNKQLQAKLQAYQKKLSIIRHNEENDVNKSKSLMSKTPKKKYNKNENNLKPQSLANLDDQFHIDEIVTQQQKLNLDKNQESMTLIYRKPRIAQKNRLNPSPTGSARYSEIHENQQANPNGKVFFNTNLNSSNVSQKKSLNSSQDNFIQLNVDSKVFDICLEGDHNKLQPIVHDHNQVSDHLKNLSLQLNVFKLDIRGINVQKRVHLFRQNTLELLQRDQCSKKVLFGRGSAVEGSLTFASSPISIKNIDLVQKSNEKINSVVQLKHIQRRNNKVQTSFAKQSLNFEQFRLDKNNNKQNQLKQKVQFVTNLSKIQTQVYIKKRFININTLKDFFIDEENAKNYQMLNVSQICGIHKRSKPVSRMQSRKGSLVGLKNLSKNVVEYELATLNLIFKKIYSQIVKTKKINKDTFLSIILFLRYPFSFVNREKQMRGELSQTQQQQTFDEGELQSHLKRIWALHNRCQSMDKSKPIVWCNHKQQILLFFGISNAEAN